MFFSLQVLKNNRYFEIQSLKSLMEAKVLHLPSINKIYLAVIKLSNQFTKSLLKWSAVEKFTKVCAILIIQVDHEYDTYFCHMPT